MNRRCKCGAQFFSENTRQKYCTRECNIKEKAKMKKAAQPKKSKPCEECGKEFFVLSMTAKYCGKDCKNKARNSRLGRQTYQKNWNAQREKREAVHPAFMELDERFYSMCRPKLKDKKRTCITGCGTKFVHSINRICSQCTVKIKKASFLAGEPYEQLHA